MERYLRIAVRPVTIGCVAATIGLAVLCLAGGAAADEPFQAQLRILTYNIFGLEEHSCDWRARGFGHILGNAQPAFDIVALNEYYHNQQIPGWDTTCEAGYLSSALECTGRYPLDSEHSFLFRPRDAPFDGGVGVLALGSICQAEESAFPNPPDDPPGARHGVILARVAIPDTTVTLDVYVLHTHSFGDNCDRCCHERELSQTAAFIQAHSARSGNPVIVMGDFNMGGPPACCGNEGYEEITSLLGAPRDLWWEAHPCGDPVRIHCGNLIAECDGEAEGYCDPSYCEGAASPPLNGCIDLDPTGCISITCSAPRAGFCDGWGGYTRTGCVNEIDPPPFPERIDYIFVVTHPALSSSAFRVDLVDSRVASWIVLRPKPETDINVSDHLGVEATINILGMSSVWVDAFQPASGTGTSCDPFSSLEQAVEAVPPGDRILLRGPGLYPERLRIDKPCRLESVRGKVIIGF